MLESKRVLLVGMGNSSHLKAYAQRLLLTGAEVGFVNSGASGKYSLPPGIIDKSNRFQRTWLGSRYLWWFDRLLFRSHLLSKIISREICGVHGYSVLVAHDLQQSGYPSNFALNGLSVKVEKPHFHAVSLGNDLFWYPRKHRHHQKLVQLAQNVKSIEVECAREIETFRALGFGGQFFSTKPNTPITMETIDFQRLAKNERLLILVKGYGGRWGQGWKGVVACWQVRSQLSGLKVLVYSPSIGANLLVSVFGKLGLPIKRLARLSRGDFLRLLQFTHIHLGVSKSDGLATTSAEAGIMGSYVIQSATSCVDDYLRDLGTVHLLHSGRISEIVSLLTLLAPLPRRHEFASRTKARKAAYGMGSQNVNRIWGQEFIGLFG
jgi:hypothetical protein